VFCGHVTEKRARCRNGVTPVRLTRQKDRDSVHRCAILWTMGLNLDLEQIVLMALIGLIVLSYWIFPPKRVGAWFARRFFPDSRARRGWREWTWAQKIIIGILLACIAALWIHGIRSLADAMATVGILLLMIGIRGLVIAPRRARPSHDSLAPSTAGPENEAPTVGDRNNGGGRASRPSRG
jgi:hypothetical protein